MTRFLSTDQNLTVEFGKTGKNPNKNSAAPYVGPDPVFSKSKTCLSVDFSAVWKNCPN
jgi:hypothetical protein